MKLYNLVHNEVVASLTQHRLLGCSFFRNSPYLYAFDSAASACLESSLYKTFRNIPPTFALIELTCPTDSLYRPAQRSRDIYGDYELGNYYIGDWLEEFLISNTALVAEIPSKNWNWTGVKNYIINSHHERFGQIQITEVFKPPGKGVAAVGVQ